MLLALNVQLNHNAAASDEAAEAVPFSLLPGGLLHTLISQYADDAVPLARLFVAQSGTNDPLFVPIVEDDGVRIKHWFSEPELVPVLLEHLLTRGDQFSPEVVDLRVAAAWRRIQAAIEADLEWTLLGRTSLEPFFKHFHHFNVYRHIGEDVEVFVDFYLSAPV